jgi:hypothetical protein
MSAMESDADVDAEYLERAFDALHFGAKYEAVGEAACAAMDPLVEQQAVLLEALRDEFDKAGDGADALVEKILADV